jgi:hypothetical protein
MDAGVDFVVDGLNFGQVEFKFEGLGFGFEHLCVGECLYFTDIF